MTEMTTREKVLKDAITCVCGDREQDYGSPENNFALIADLWSAYRGVTFTPVDVAMMMALLKVARIRTGRGKMDSFVDTLPVMPHALQRSQANRTGYGSRKKWGRIWNEKKRDRQHGGRSGILSGAAGEGIQELSRDRSKEICQ